ncbi:MAG: carboxypeptidase-like regulatory domain-containing protein [Candidatus Andersenbacteria bacterium]
MALVALCIGAAILAAWLTTALFANQLHVDAQILKPPRPPVVNAPVNLPVNIPITNNTPKQPPIVANNGTNTVVVPAPAPVNTTNQPANTTTNQPAPLPVPAPTPLPLPAPLVPTPTGLSIAFAADHIASPVAAALAILNLLFAASLATWYPLLLRVFLEPLQLFSARRKPRWGVVYDSLTKVPIDLAIVRLYHVDGRLARTAVTDRSGRYGFLVDQPAPYRIDVSKADYRLSHLLGGKHADEQYANLYTGGVFTLAEPTFVNFNIPVDHDQVHQTVRQVLRRHYRRFAHVLIAYAGVLVGLVAFGVARTRLALVLLVLHVLVLLVFRRVAAGSRARPWGTVYDSSNDRPLPHAVVRIFDTQYDRLLESQVADRFARYGFLVGKGSYRLDAVRSGYQFPSTGKIRPRDYVGGPIRRTGADGVVAVNLPLDHAPAGPEKT